MINNIVEIKDDDDLKQVIEIQKQSLLDFSKISDLNYREEIQNNGFFIAPYTLDELVEDKNKILLGIKERNEVLAFVWVSEYVDNRDYIWSDAKIKENIFNKKIYKLKAIGVKKSKQGQGLASELLNNLNSYLNDKSIKYLVGTIAVNPIKNLASINFHKKNGFEEVAISPKHEYFEFKDYKCSLFAKKLD